MRTRQHRAFAIAPAIAALAQIFSSAAFAQEPCRLTPIGSAQVAAVRDGRTLSLTDGRELRLAAIEAPDASRAGLQNLVSGQALRLEAFGTDYDRYGRLVAFAFVGENQQSVQQAMLEAGLAQVATRAGGRPCAETLLSAERKARQANRGLWADPNFAPLPAESPNLLARRGQFALVEGKVLSVHPSGGTIYVNFGRRWTRDFTVTIRRRLQRSFTAAGVEPSKLQGRRIRVRGFIEQHGGPIIDAEYPEQIEFADRQMTGG
jgi:endonuclease YncB( thermonuclease family)